MNHMKTKALVLLASSSLIASAAFADNNWKLSAGLNYQEFGNNGTQYATQDSNKEFNVDTDYHTGYFLDWMYHLEEKDSDVGFDYNHLRASDSSSLTGNNIQIQPGGLGTATWASGMTTFTYDSFDLKAGHTVKLSPSFSLGYYGGLNYTRLEKELVSEGTAPGSTFNSDIGSRFSGIGPDFGMEGDCYPFYDRYPAFGVFGGVDTKVLYGTRTGFYNTMTNSVLSSTSIPNEHIVVPAVGAKIGVQYTFRQYVDARLGYDVTQYFGVATDSTTNRNDANVGFAGPFFDVTLRY